MTLYCLSLFVECGDMRWYVRHNSQHSLYSHYYCYSLRWEYRAPAFILYIQVKSFIFLLSSPHVDLDIACLSFSIICIDYIIHRVSSPFSLLMYMCFYIENNWPRNTTGDEQYNRRCKYLLIGIASSSFFDQVKKFLAPVVPFQYYGGNKNKRTRRILLLFGFAFFLCKHSSSRTDRIK